MEKGHALTWIISRHGMVQCRSQCVQVRRRFNDTTYLLWRNMAGCYFVFVNKLLFRRKKGQQYQRDAHPIGAYYNGLRVDGTMHQRWLLACKQGEHFTKLS